MKICILLVICCFLIFGNVNLYSIKQEIELDEGIIVYSSSTKQSDNENVTPEFQGKCTVPKDAGFCTFWHTMFYYDKINDRCEKFNYSGCGGNENRFYDYYTCENECRQTSSLESDCLEAQDSGNCSEKFDQYFYDKDTNECKHFYYTGCNGNKNRFHDKDSCENLCLVKVHRCLLPADPGFGNYAVTMFYYNASEEQCRPFVYRGSMGNENKFYDEDECEIECIMA